jgi:hypothetical protein
MPKHSVLLICKTGDFNFQCNLITCISCRKQCILAESRFDFLKDLVLTIPDVQAEGEDGGVTSVPSTPTVQQHQPLMFRSLSEAGSSSSTSKSKGTGTGRPRGRPRKTPAALAPAQNNQRF